jgi:transposase
MSIYPPGASGASCACPGCLCRDRVPRYPSDLTDAQWELLRPEAEQVMAELRRASGRPMVHDLRAMLDGIGYVVRNGIEWRALPVDFPPWEAVYAFFQRWLLRYRRLVRDYERRPQHHEAMVYWATIMIMTRRLARRAAGPPIKQRWGRPRPAAPRPNPAPA